MWRERTEKLLKIWGISLITDWLPDEVVLGAKKGGYGITKGTVKSQIRIKSGWYGTIKSLNKSKTIKEIESIT